MRTDVLRAVARKLTTTPLREVTSVYSGTDPDAGLAGSSRQSIYRRTGQATSDLPQDVADRIVSRAFLQYRQNPYARQYVQLMTDIIGSGQWTILAEDQRVQEVLDEFWSGSYNDWPAWMRHYQRCLMLAGRLCLPVSVGAGGSVRVGYTDPLTVRDPQTYQGNPRHIDSVIWRVGRESYPVQVVRPEFDPLSQNAGRLVAGDPAAPVVADVCGMLYFRAGGFPDTLLGSSDLEAATDYLSALEEWHAGQLELADVLGRMIGDVTIKGTPTAQVINDRAAALAKTPGFASVLVHSEGEEHHYSATSTGASDAEIRDRVHGTFATLSLGPPHLIRGEMGEGNRAIAQSSTEPFYLRVRSKLDDLRIVVQTACRYAVDQAAIAGRLGRGVDESFTVTPPKILNRDRAVGAQALAGITQSVILAESRGWIPTSAAREIWAAGCAEIGVDLDPDQMVERLETEGAAGSLQSDALALLRREPVEPGAEEPMPAAEGADLTLNELTLGIERLIRAGDVEGAALLRQKMADWLGAKRLGALPKAELATPEAEVGR